MTLAESLLAGAGLGIASAFHCAAMCGVFALRAAAATSSVAALGRFSAYIAGKTFTYVFLGAMAGFVGARVLDDSQDLRAWAAVGASALLILVGFLNLLPRRRASIFAQLLGPATQRVVHGLGRAAQSGFALGALTGLLPCGVVYLAAIQAAASGSVLSGVSLMAAFGLATVPSLVAVGFLGRSVGRIGACRRLAFDLLEASC